MDARDLSEEEVGRIRHRLALAFGRRPLLPLQSLRYRLGETGQLRVHPYALKRVLGAVSRKPGLGAVRGTPDRPWEVAPFVFASGELKKADLAALAREHEPDFDLIAGCKWEEGANGFVQAISEHVGELEEVSASPSAADDSLDGERLIRGHSGFYRLRPEMRSSEIRIWVTQQIDQLGPDDPRLWAVLKSCQEADARLLIIARYIHPTSFVLFKALGVRGLQYYNFWAPRQYPTRLKTAADELGWFSVKGSREAPAHRILQQLTGTVKYLLQSEIHAPVERAVSLAEDASLAEGSLPVTTALIGWAEHAPVELPDAWLETIRRFQAWNSDTPFRIARTPVARRIPSARSKRNDRAEAPVQTAVAEAAENPPVRRGTTVSRVPIRGW